MVAVAFLAESAGPADDEPEADVIDDDKESSEDTNLADAAEREGKRDGDNF